VYGSTPPPMTEDDLPAPEDSYGIAKYAVEMELRACRDLFGLNYVVFRPHNVYGPRQNIADRYRNVVGIFMNQILQRQPMTIFGDGTQTRAFSYIDDVAPVMADAIETPAAWNETFNIGADEPYSLLQLAGRGRRGYGSRAADRSSGRASRGAARALVSREGASYLRCQPHTSLEEGSTAWPRGCARTARV
jgi:UDP-glucose 4-epimerase